MVLPLQMSHLAPISWNWSDSFALHLQKLTDEEDTFLRKPETKLQAYGQRKERNGWAMIASQGGQLVDVDGLFLCLVACKNSKAMENQWAGFIGIFYISMSVMYPHTIKYNKY